MNNPKKGKKYSNKECALDRFTAIYSESVLRKLTLCACRFEMQLNFCLCSVCWSEEQEQTFECDARANLCKLRQQSLVNNSGINCINITMSGLADCCAIFPWCLGNKQRVDMHRTGKFTKRTRQSL